VIGVCPAGYRTLTTTRIVHYAPPGVTTAEAARRAAELASPLQHSTRPWQPGAATPDPSSTEVPTVTPGPESPAQIFLPLIQA
jgi:hypothetical protein